jgi:cell cycle arrest protein BUB3
MDLCSSKNLLLLATAGRHIYLYDTRALTHGPLQKRESSLKYQSRQVRFFADGSGFVCGSVEGRVAVDFVDASAEGQAQRYAFKCHRQAASQADPATGAPMEVVYPVNALAYHPK